MAVAAFCRSARIYKREADGGGEIAALGFLFVAIVYMSCCRETWHGIALSGKEMRPAAATLYAWGNYGGISSSQTRIVKAEARI